MNKQAPSIILGILAGTIFIAGIIASISSLVRYPSIRRQQAKDITTSKILIALENKFSQLDIQTAPLRKLSYTKLADPEVIIKNVFGANKIENIQKDKNNCGPEYAINQIEISLKDITLKKLPEFIRNMETLRPPFRLTSCTIRSSTTTSGSGNMKLRFERVERQQK
jgi:hypothetical protein